jgi:hypothetical protein
VRCLTREECREWRREHARRREWRYEFECYTPLKDLPWFAARLVETVGAFRLALVEIDVIFDPLTLNALRRTMGEDRRVGEAPGHLVEANPGELVAVLAAALADTVNVHVFFAPSRVAIFGHHDERTTVRSSTPVGALREALKERGIKFL